MDEELNEILHSPKNKLILSYEGAWNERGDLCSELFTRQELTTLGFPSIMSVWCDTKSCGLQLNSCILWKKKISVHYLEFQWMLYHALRKPKQTSNQLTVPGFWMVNEFVGYCLCGKQLLCGACFMVWNY